MSQSELPANSRSNPGAEEDLSKLGTGTPDLSGRALGVEPRSGRLIALAVSAGLLAGVGSWLIGEAALSAFRPPYEAQQIMGQTILKAKFEDRAAADTKNAGLAFGVLGGMLSLALGIAGGLARRSIASGVKAGIVGLVLGGLLAAATSLALVPVYYRALDKDQEALSHDLALPLMIHGGAWAVCGLAGGLVFGIGLGGGRARLLNSALGGLIGAALGAAAYEMIGAVAFPAARTASPISFTPGTRLLARMLVASLTGLVAAASVKRTSPRLPAAQPKP